MKVATVALAAVAVYLLGLAMIASATASVPVGGTDRCRTCHTSAHPQGWTRSTHGAVIGSGEVPAAWCTRCHTTSYCSSCHSQITTKTDVPQSD